MSPRKTRSTELSADGSSSRIVCIASCNVPAEGVRQPAGQQLVQDDAERVDVAARIELERVGEHLLRAHVGERADELPDVRLKRRLRVAVGDARDAEVEDLRLPGFVDQDVAGFRSRWMRPRWCAWCTASQILRHQLEPLARRSTLRCRRNR